MLSFFFDGKIVGTVRFLSLTDGRKTGMQLVDWLFLFFICTHIQIQ